MPVRDVKACQLILPASLSSARSYFQKKKKGKKKIYYLPGLYHLPSPLALPGL